MRKVERTIYGRKKQINYKFIPTSLFRGAHSSGDLMRIHFTIAYLQCSLSNLCSAKLTGQLLRKRVLFLWRQEDTSSLRLFSVDSSGRQMIRNFSLRQRLHLLLELLYGERSISFFLEFISVFIYRVGFSTLFTLVD